MAVNFSRTTRSLAADGPGRALLIWVITLGLMALWLAWFLLASVQVYAVSQQARLEVEGAGRPVAVPVAGRLTATRLRIGQQVAAGEVLAELDAESARLRLKEEQARLAARPGQIEALRREIAAEEDAATQARGAAASAAREARARHGEAESTAAFAQENRRRLAELGAKGRISEIELLRAGSEADKARAAAEALAMEAGRLDSEAQGRGHLSRADVEALRREIAMLEGEMVSIQAVIARLEDEVEQHRIRAPVAGEIGEVAPLKAGGVVNAGEVLATLIPAGELRLVADFDPATVLGRVQPGQVGELRLDAFAWTQYGAIRARVVGVGREIRNGRVRVDLLPDVAGHADIPLQHGLPGTVEIAIERTTPALLVLRAAGRMLARPAVTDPQRGAGDAAAPAGGPQG